MKILLYLYYFLRSAGLRGLLNTIRLLRSEFKYEKLFRIKTRRIAPSDSDQFYHYQGAPYFALNKVFKELPEHIKQYEFIDVGCGKGRVAFVAERFGFNKITGIELQDELVKEAKENLKTYTFKRAESEIKFVHANALEYDYPSAPAVYFFFNPFNEEVMRKVLDRIIGKNEGQNSSPRSHSASHYETWFIYLNPQYPEPFENKNLRKVRVLKTGRYVEGVVYKN